MTNEDKMNTE